MKKRSADFWLHRVCVSKKRHSRFFEGGSLRSSPRLSACGRQFDAHSAQGGFSHAPAAGKTIVRYFAPAGAKLLRRAFWPVGRGAAKRLRRVLLKTQTPEAYIPCKSPSSQVSPPESCRMNTRALSEVCLLWWNLKRVPPSGRRHTISIFPRGWLMA